MNYAITTARTSREAEPTTVSGYQTIGAALKRCRITVFGRVQGVGFRPTLYRELTARGCAGCVRNTPRGVVVEVEAPEETLRAVVRGFRDIVPERARVDELQVEEAEPRGDTEFRIIRSRADGQSLLPIPPDMAICERCRAELRDPDDRRFGYAFNTCTSCGPRFTIAREVPFDREANSMDEFPPCPECAREYSAPADRRLHAQTLSCPACGPKLAFLSPAGARLDRPLERARRMLRKGAIVAVKGVGGFHLACDAAREDVVQDLRRRKRRTAKPFALMVKDLATCESICHVSELESDLLTSAQAPVVLLRKRTPSPVADAVAPGLAQLGVMLPYTPLHMMLFDHDAPQMPAALVMTSCNRSDEPIATEDQQVLEGLSDIVDGVLTHDRAILNRCDDSVVAAADGRTMPLRRSRGYVPEPIVLADGGPPVLATGAMLKNTFALTSGRRVFLSQHIGDVSDADNAAHFARAFRDFSRLLRLEPEVVVCDMHPDYPTTEFARKLSRERGLPLIQVQHHHAHVVSCMAENGYDGRVIGVSWDGTGYGADGAVWGGEFLVADRRDYERRFHLAYVPMPGGDRAVWEPVRMALAHLLNALGRDRAVREMEKFCGAGNWKSLAQVAERRRFSPLTSSAGRLFDAVAALLGVCREATYQGQPACELEAHAEPGVEGAYGFDYARESILVDELWRGILQDLSADVPVGVIAGKFHRTVERMIVETCRRLGQETGLATVALSGGVIQNRTLVSAVAPALRREGFTVLLQTEVPPNDGGISLGQAACAVARLQTGGEN